MHAVEQRFGRIQFDLAASVENAKAKNFFSLEQNSLAQPWHKIPGLLWLNPPFANIEPWAKKCFEESILGAQIAFLTPASVGSNWFARWVFDKAWVHFLNGRISFDGVDPYPKDCILSFFGEPVQRFEVWRWNQL